VRDVSGRVRPKQARHPWANGRLVGIKVVEHSTFSHGGNTGSGPVGSAKDCEDCGEFEGCAYRSGSPAIRKPSVIRAA
jgi:hypothetical protein